MAPDSYKYGGARALVALHAKHLREFVAIWRRADDQTVELLASANPNYASREALLAHVLGCAARYLTWICEKLELPEPNLEEYPDPGCLAARVDEYLEDVLAAWERPLRGLTEELADSRVYESWWGVPYSIDAMLEHAVMHPIRHAHQLQELLAQS
jgi:uncharacterized damage-inducible protein DinB